MRTKLKGWNIRRLGDQKRERKELLGELVLIDEQSKSRELSSEEWTHRYDVER